MWSHGGIICTGETYKHVVTMTFAKGASLVDPAGLFNSSLEGNTRRAIDLHAGDRERQLWSAPPDFFKPDAYADICESGC